MNFVAEWCLCFCGWCWVCSNEVIKTFLMAPMLLLTRKVYLSSHILSRVHSPWFLVSDLLWRWTFLLRSFSNCIFFVIRCLCRPQRLPGAWTSRLTRSSSRARKSTTPRRAGGPSSEPSTFSRCWAAPDARSTTPRARASSSPTTLSSSSTCRFWISSCPSSRRWSPSCRTCWTRSWCPGRCRRSRTPSSGSVTRTCTWGCSVLRLCTASVTRRRTRTSCWTNVGRIWSTLTFTYFISLSLISFTFTYLFSPIFTFTFVIFSPLYFPVSNRYFIFIYQEDSIQVVLVWSSGFFAVNI